jgi:integrase
MLMEIARKKELTCTTFAHIKAFLSGAFRHAKRQGVLNSENPMRDVVLPKAKPGGDTYAYSLEEIIQMLHVLNDAAATIVAAAAFTGVRKGELRGFLWENYHDKQIVISQSFWRGHAQPPKTKQSRAPVPVIAQLAERLDRHRMLSGNPRSGLMFPGIAGKPVNLDALVVRVIRPALKNAGLSWHGWHAFRRGLATTLHRLGVPDKTNQAILRHANVAVTQACYIKTLSDDVAAAMLSLEYAPSMHLESTRKPQVM